jgi:hypothetical protein
LIVGAVIIIVTAVINRVETKEVVGVAATGTIMALCCPCNGFKKTMRETINSAVIAVKRRAGSNTKTYGCACNRIGECKRIIDRQINITSGSSTQVGISGTRIHALENAAVNVNLIGPR